jgi:hypothetical protein
MDPHCRRKCPKQTLVDEWPTPSLIFAPGDKHDMMMMVMMMVMMVMEMMVKMVVVVVMMMVMVTLVTATCVSSGPEYTIPIWWRSGGDLLPIAFPGAISFWALLLTIMLIAPIPTPFPHHDFGLSRWIGWASSAEICRYGLDTLLPICRLFHALQ